MVQADLVIKLGGSAVTHKDVPLSPNLDAIAQIARELSAFKLSSKVVLVHGGGSFGHYEARKYLQGGVIADPRGIAEVRAAMLSLAKVITDTFLENGVPIFVINPSGSFVLNGGSTEPSSTFLQPVERCLESGLMPAIGGDVVLDSSGGARILSGDTIARLIALRLDARLLAFGTDVGGVLSGRKIIEEISKEDLPGVASTLSGRPGDVTGGMAGKLREICSYLHAGGKEALIFNITKSGLLTKILKGEKVEGTYIR